MSTRSIERDGTFWFPVIDLAGYKIKNEKNRIKPAVIAWLKRNLPDGSIDIFQLEEKKKKKYVCLSSEASIIFGMYQNHIESGGDFRARWSELPDTPSLFKDSLKELSWKNLYKWSKSEHFAKTKIATRQLEKMRIFSEEYKLKFGEYSSLSYKDSIKRFNDE